MEMWEARGFRLMGSGIIAAAWVVAGCATDPDIIATQKADTLDGAFIKVKQMDNCKPGKYAGNMSTQSEAGVSQFPFTADFTFSLIQVLGGEFYVLQDTSTLSGSGTDGSMFSAEITGGRACVDGAFETKLLDGKYYLPKSTMPVDFDGSINGIYTSKYDGFNGQWASTLHFPAPFGDVPVAGGWSAHYLGPVPSN